VASSSLNFSGLQSDGFAGHLTALMNALPQPGSPNAAPTSAPTTAANVDAASTLTTATYYAVVTETNGLGETTASPVSTPGVAITSGTNHLTVTPPTKKTGNTATNIYIGTSSTGPFYLAAAGVTGATNIAAPITNSWAQVNPPTANTTALSAKQIELLRGVLNGQADRVIQRVKSIVRDFLRGDPQNYAAVVQAIADADVVFSVLNQQFGELGALIIANPGTISTTHAGAEPYHKQVRVWP
jgi:hypothetical protein